MKKSANEMGTILTGFACCSNDDNNGTNILSLVSPGNFR